MNNATTDITDTTYNASTSGNRQRNTYMLIGFSFISLLMIGIFLAFVHRKCRQSTSSAKQWCISCCSRQPENRCPSVSRTEEVTGTENNTTQVKPEPEHLYENLAFTDDDGKIKKEVVVKEKCVNLKREMQQCSGFCDTEDDSGISDVCTSPRYYESNSSVDNRYFAYENGNGLHVYYNDSFDYDIGSKSIIRVLMPENLDIEYKKQKRKKHIHVYENIDKNQHTYVNVAKEKITPPAQSQHQHNHQQQQPQQQHQHQHHQQQQQQQQDRRFRDRDTRHHTSRRQHPDVCRVHPMCNMDPYYENLQPDKRLEYLSPETVYYVNEHSTDSMLEALGNSFRHSQRKWRNSLLQQEQNMSLQNNTNAESIEGRSPPSKIRHARGFYRNSSWKRNVSSHRNYQNSSSEYNHHRPSRVDDREERVVTQYVKAADGTLRAITLHM